MTLAALDGVHRWIQLSGIGSRLAVMGDRSIPRKNQASPRGVYMHQFEVLFVGKYCMYALRLDKTLFPKQ